MKARRGFHRLVVDGAEYQFAVSLSARREILIVYRADETRAEIPIVPSGGPSGWRGKHGAGGYGKREAAALIRQHFPPC